MDLNHYQVQAHGTLKAANVAGSDTMVSILGLAGEVGELLNEYKKRLRDGEAHARFQERVAEELGDILWYTAETATKFGLKLNDVATQNLQKTQARWGFLTQPSDPVQIKPRIYDAGFPEHERFRRRFTAEFVQTIDNGVPCATVIVDGQQMGQSLTDNAHDPDGYRFHDVFHLACVSVLGWSPVTRRNLGRKRRSDPNIDEVEDGGRAIVTEEGVSALVFAYAADHNSLEGVSSVDYDLLKAIRIMTARLEVSVCTSGEWERAILLGYQVWKQVQEHRGGHVRLDLDKRSIEYVDAGSLGDADRTRNCK